MCLPANVIVPAAATRPAKAGIGVQTNTPRFSSYVASKAALDAFSRCIASEVVDDGVAHDTHDPGLLVDLDLADLRPVGKRDGGRRERGLLAEARLHALRELARHIGGARDVGERHAAVRARHRELSVAMNNVLRRGLQ